MNGKISLGYFIFFAVFQVTTFAADEDSVSTARHADGVQFLAERDFISAPISLRSIDTSLRFFQYYNPADNQQHPYLHLGNLGLPHRSLLFDIPGSTGFDLGFHHLDAYLFKENDVKYYNTKSPYTQLHYIVGPEEEQLFNVTHTQNLSSNVNVGLKYQRLVSNGIYARHRSDMNNLMAWSWLQTSDERYQAFTQFTFNKANVDESGGVVNDSFFTDPDLIRRNIVPINLSEAQNRIRSKGVRVYHSLGFGKHYTLRINDTTNVKKYFSRSRFSHTFSFMNSNYVYADNAPNEAYYPTTLYSNVSTLDSLQISKYENILSFKTLGTKDRINDTISFSNSIFKVGVNYTFYEFFQQPLNELIVDTTFDELIVNMEWKSNDHASKKLIYGLFADYSVMGYGEGDHNFRGLLGYVIGKAGKLKLEAATNRRSPDWIHEHYQSNHFSWENDFEKVNIQSLEMSFSNDSANLWMQVKHYLIDNFVYWDTNAVSRQSSESINGMVITVGKRFTWRKLHLDNYLIFQSFDSDLIHLPDIVGRQSFYYERMYFKRAVRAKFGIDVSYNSNYYADKYMVVTSQFYLQNEKELSFYPVFDAFISIKIKRGRIFLKSEHVSQGIFDKGYFSAFHYPMADRAIKFGVSWLFFD